jgi:hypothetical protein
MTMQRMQKLHRLPEVCRTDKILSQIEEKIFRIFFTFFFIYTLTNCKTETIEYAFSVYMNPKLKVETFVDISVRRAKFTLQILLFDFLFVF